MGKLDEVKEILNTLRVAMSVLFGTFVLIVGKLLSMYDREDFSDLFWLGIAVSIANLGAIILIVKKITKKTKEIGEL